MAFRDVVETSLWVQILVSTYLRKMIMDIMDTPFLYLARYIHKGHLEIEKQPVV